MPLSRAETYPRYIREVLKKEFVVDEVREKVVNPVVRRATTESPDESEHPPVSSQADLLSQISRMVLEQEHLKSIAEELRNTGGKDSSEEFMRFFKASLPFLDSFDRVLKMAQDQKLSEEMQNWVRSFSAVQTRVMDVFERYGLRAMDPAGKKVNLDRHEVVDVIATDSIPDETIVEVRQKGYQFSGKVLRDAKVVVAQNHRR